MLVNGLNNNPYVATKWNWIMNNPYPLTVIVYDDHSGIAGTICNERICLLRYPSHGSVLAFYS